MEYMTYKCNKSVAILLAAYNAEKYLSAQVDSILSQTYHDWILYIRNDASSDNTQSIIDDYVNNYPQRIVQVDKGGRNLGCRNNFFRLLEAVDSDYYMFCDADDVWLPSKIEESVNAIKEMERKNGSNVPLLAFCDTIVCREDMSVIASSYWRSAKIDPYRYLSYNIVAVCCIVGGSCSIFNRNVKGILFPLADNNLIYDYWIALCVAKSGKFGIINKPLKYYRQHENQVCGVSVGKQGRLLYKLRNIKALYKQYLHEARELREVGYGPVIKYFWYKFIVLTMKLSHIN